MSKKYVGKDMIKASRMITYFSSLDPKIQDEVVSRIDELVQEEKEYCDKGNYEHMSNILSLLSIYEVLQKHGETEENAFNIVKEEMHKFIIPFKEKFQKMSTKKWFWPLIKKIVPLGFKKKSGIGWRYTWHKSKDKNDFRFETNECIYAKIFKKRHLEKLGPLFCQCDVINYGELHNIDFKRTKTLCYGDDECNFIFIKHPDGNFIRTKGR